MDSSTPKDEKELISRDQLFLLRKQKVKKEIEAAKRLLKRKIDILEIGDNFIHSMFELLKDGISSQNNNLTEEEINQQIRNIMLFEEKLKLKRKRYNEFG